MTTKDKVLLIFILLFGIALIPLGDTAGKLLMQVGVSPLFVAWSRLLIGFLFILALSGIKLSEISHAYDWRLLLRAGLFICSVTLILAAVETESLANIFGAFFIGPIISYFLAAWLLKEGITLIRSILLLIGFGGALLVIKPGINMTLGMGLATLAGCFYGGLLVANRWLAGSFRPRFILFVTLLCGSVVLAPVGITAIPNLNTYTVMLLFVSALASAIGNLIIIEANTKLPASVVAPFIYTQLIAATFFSIVVFDSWPDIYSLVGLIILFVSGLASFMLSHKR